MTAIADLRAKKSRLREQARALRAVTKASGADGDAIAHAAALIKQWPEAAVSGFYSFDNEIDCLALLAELAGEGHVTALPVVEAPRKPLLFRRWKKGDPTEPGVYDIPVPLESAEQVTPDVLIVPLLAFDARGYRLGYGGGFYDRTLAALRAQRPTTAIGLAFAAQEVRMVPAGPHDEPLDWIVTEEGARAARNEK